MLELTTRSFTGGSVAAWRPHDHQKTVVVEKWAQQGIEPPLLDLESEVLPLHHEAHTIPTTKQSGAVVSAVGS